MDLLSNLVLGLSVAITPYNLMFCFFGAMLGTLVGVLPGLGPTATIAMLLPLTFSLPPEASLIMLAGIFYGAQYGGSTTAILINLPGEASSSVTVLDGYQMARQGRAGPALAASAIGSFAAGTVATLVIAIFALPMTDLALKFQSPEYFSLIVLGLLTSVALARGSVLKGLAMIVMGLLLSLVGTDTTTGVQRFNFGFEEYADGLNFVAVSVGIFGITEMLRNLESNETREVFIKKVVGLMPTREDLKAIVAPVIRGTAIGSLLGVLPGGGSILASFAAYTVEKKVAKDPSRFGKGAIEGVASPESANNAGAQTSFIPMLTLGIPGNPVMAMMMGAMIIQGIVPGPAVATEQPRLFWGIIASMWIGNAMLVILNLPLIGLWVRLLTVPYYLLIPIITVFSTIGVYSVTNSVYDVYTMIGLGIFGYVLAKLDFEPAPLVLGFVLGPMFEEHLRRSMILSRGDPMIFLQRPISASLLIVALIAIVVSLLPMIAKKRDQVFVEEG